MKLRFAALTAVLLNFTAAARGDWAEYLLLSAADDTAVLEDNGNPSDNLIRLRSTNGTFPTIDFAIPDAVLAVDMGPGNDRLFINGADLPNLAVDILIYGGAGDDRTDAAGIVNTGGIFSDDPDGDNGLLIRQSEVRGPVFVFDGDGFQTLNISGSVIGSDIAVYSTDGGNQVSIGTGTQPGLSSFAEQSVFIEAGGYGNDSIRIFGTVVGDVMVNGGFDNVDLSSIFSTIGSLAVYNQSGLTDVFLGDVGVLTNAWVSSAEGSTSIEAYFTTVGNGLYVSNGLGFDSCLLQNVTAAEIQLHNGEGGSETTVREAFGPVDLKIDTLTVQNGDGTDTVRVFVPDSLDDGFPQIRSLSAHNGAGNSTLDLGGSARISELVFSAESGFDAVQLDSAEITNSFLAWLGDGGTDVQFRDTIVRGMTAVTTGSGSDFISLADSIFDGAVWVHTGDDEDTLLAVESLFRSEFGAFGGSGTDTYVRIGMNIFEMFEYLESFEVLLEF